MEFTGRFPSASTPYLNLCLWLLLSLSSLPILSFKKLPAYFTQNKPSLKVLALSSTCRQRPVCDLGILTAPSPYRADFLCLGKPVTRSFEVYSSNSKRNQITCTKGKFRTPQPPEVCWKAKAADSGPRSGRPMTARACESLNKVYCWFFSQHINHVLLLQLKTPIYIYHFP